MSSISRRSIVWVCCLALVAASAVMFYRWRSQLPVVVRVSGPATPPFLNRDASGRYQGPTFDLFNRAAQHRRIQLQWVQPGQDLRSDLGPRYDIYLQVPNAEPYRSSVHLTKPWIHSEYILLARREKALAIRQRLPGLRIGIPEFGFPRPLISQFLPAVHETSFRVTRDMLVRVCRDELDAGVATARIAPALLLDRPLECNSQTLDWIPIPSGRIEVSLAAAPGFERVADSLRNELGVMAGSGEIAQIYLPYAGVGSDLAMFLNLEELASHSLASQIQSALLALLALGLLIGIYWLSRARREAERLSLEANAASRAKSDFVAMISHELRTPVHGFVGMTSLLLDTPLAPGQRELVRSALDAAGHLQTLLNDVLDLAKIESGKFEVVETPFALRTMLEGCAASLDVTLRDKPVELSLTGIDACPEWVLGDEKCLRQVLMNLGSNAVKFTETGSVDLSVLLEAEDADGYTVRLAVSDTGIGIREDYLPRVFERFEQADGSHARRYGGTGLGLAIVKQLLRLMGSRIEVESEVGKGSRFHFQLRLPRAVAPPLQSAPALPGNLSGLVLVAEDNLVNQRVLARFLERLGLDYVIAADGDKAMHEFAVRQFDLILMDCQMPSMDGFEAARRIRQLDQGRTIPIIALSANATADDRERCLLAGMNDFLAKPFRLDVLASTVARWLPPRSLSATSV